MAGGRLQSAKEYWGLGAWVRGVGGGTLVLILHLVVAGLQHRTWRKLPPSAPGSLIFAREAFLVSQALGWTLAQVVDPKQSFTGVQKPPSSLWVEPCPGLHSASPWKPRGAHQQLPAIPAHRVPGVPAEAGQMPAT